MKKKFKIEYRDPKTNEVKTVEEEFDHSAEFPAKMWADDYGYMLADKGWYRITEIA